MKHLLLTAAFMAVSLRLSAAEPIVMQLYPDSPESPTLYVYPAAQGDGTAIVSCPGGAYGWHAMEHEGHEFAPWLNENGVTYAVLQYRLPKGRNEVPSADAREAIRVMRSHAADWKAEKVGIMGFSAGGHLAATVATHATGEERPDFQILFYPVISMNPSYTHQMTHDNLLGDSATVALELYYSNDLQVSATTPPALIFSSWDDDAVAIKHTLNYSRALADAGVPASVFIFPTGGHGWGFHDSFTYKHVWQQLFIDWIQNLENQ